VLDKQPKLCYIIDMKLLGIDTNAKTVKGQKKGYMTAIIYLAPSDASGIINTCANASEGCRSACLYTAGRGKMNMVQQARIAKTSFFAKQRKEFMNQLKREILALVKKASKVGKIPCVRLNGTSDLPWEKVKLEGKSIMEHFSGLQFYDYTKSLTRMVDWCNGKMPKNYHLTFSRCETTDDDVVKGIIKRGGNVAVVYKGEPPTIDFNADVVNGDESDLRFLDKQGVVVGLIAKGDAKHDDTGFVLEPNIDLRKAKEIGVLC